MSSSILKWASETAARMFQRLASLDWLAALLTRLFVGYFFFETGWAKINNLESFTARFAAWGIPYPAFNAALSAYTECLGEHSRSRAWRSDLCRSR